MAESLNRIMGERWVDLCSMSSHGKCSERRSYGCSRYEHNGSFQIGFYFRHRHAFFVRVSISQTNLKSAPFKENVSQTRRTLRYLLLRLYNNSTHNSICLDYSLMQWCSVWFMHTCRFTFCDWVSFRSRITLKTKKVSGETALYFVHLFACSSVAVCQGASKSTQFDSNLNSI